MGSRVKVIAKLERRVQITEPIAGWCSMKSSNGDLILTPCEESRPSVPVTPSANSNAKTNYKNFAKQERAIQADIERKDANIQNWTSGLSAEARQRVQNIKTPQRNKHLKNSCNNFEP